MLFASAFEDNRLVERLVRVRRNPLAAYGIAVGTVVVATVLRQAFGGQVMEGLPFITYFPAIVIATLCGGFWPGVLATILSSAAAWYLFLPPAFNFGLDDKETVSLFLFIFIAGINVVLVALLNSAIERILAQEQNVRILIESSPTGIVVIDEQGVVQLINKAAEKQFGWHRADLVGKSVEVLVPSENKAHRALREAFLLKPEARPMGAGRDLRAKRKDGSEFPIEIGLNPVGRNSRIAVLATVIDISERKKAQDRQQFLIRELHHRSQNLFTVIQAIASRSLEEGRAPSEAKEVLNGRLRALGRAHAMLANAAWQGAPLAQIIKEEFAGVPESMTVSGCDILVSTQAAQNFALIIHELATNAFKYGALSSAGGHVMIEGRIEQANGHPSFRFRWKESGGPPVVPPNRKGFGSAILLDAARQFTQDVTVDYDPKGLTYELRLALSAIEAEARSDDAAPAGR